MGIENRTIGGCGYLGVRYVQRYTAAASTVIQIHQNHQNLVLDVLVS